MNFYKIIVAYDGTDFYGWQIQPNNITVTSTLQKTWFDVFNESINIVGASRTDTGVHALGQIARFQSNLQISDFNLCKAWNARLPSSIRIRSLIKMNEYFHPCVNVKQKTYYYTLFLKRPLPMVSRFGWYYSFIDQVDKEKFYKCLQLYQGTHDFGSFCKIEDNENVSSIRTIHEIKVQKFLHYKAIIVSIKGPSFVRFQIRRMVGYALDLARRSHLPIDYLHDLLKNPNPKQTLLKADGSGLCLRKIEYF